VAHLVGGEHRLGGHLETGQPRRSENRLDADKVGGGEHLSLTPSRLRDRCDAAMRDGAAHEREVAHAGEANVTDELAHPAQVAIIFLARDRVSYATSLDLIRHAFSVAACAALDMRVIQGARARSAV